MRNWLLLVVMSFPLVVLGQSEVSQFIPTNEIRNSRIFPRQEIVIYNIVDEPNLLNPYLVVNVSKWISSQKTQERRYVDRNVLTARQRRSLRLAILFKRVTYDIVQGLPEESMVWKRENEFFPPKHEPNQDIPILITMGDSTQALRTDNSGNVKINLDELAHLSEGGFLKIRLALAEKPYVMQEYSFSSAELAWLPDRMLLREESTGIMAENNISGRLSYESETQGPVETPAILSEEDVEITSAEIIDRITPIGVNETSEIRELIEAPSLLLEGEFAELSRENKLSIAILDFDGYGVSQVEAMVLTNRLSTHLVQQGTHRVIERGEMEQIINEQNFQITGCT